MMRAKSLVLAMTCLAAVAFGARPASAQLMKTERVASALAYPLFVTHAPGDPYRLYIVLKQGSIRILDLRNPGAGTTLFMDINDRVVNISSVGDERGLLGLAFDPNYESTGQFFVYYINNSNNTQISRFTRLSADAGDPASEDPVLGFTQPSTNHNGGWMGFGPNDGYLYISSGDGGGAGDDDAGHNASFGNGQATNTLLGKILRIDVNGDDFPADATRDYAIPPTNPVIPDIGGTALPEIWAFGVRNAWRPSFDRQTGDFYIADVGQGLWEEINFQPASSAGGENYGWRCFEGTATFNSLNCASTGPKISPFLVYGHNTAVPPTNTSGHCSITGGYVYRGCALDPTLDGTYFFADYCTARIWSVKHTGGVPGSYSDYAERTTEFVPTAGGSLVAIVSFGEDAFGELYMIRHSGLSGEIHKIVPFTAPADCNTNNIADVCEIALGLVPDVNNNGIPDICGPCDGDADGDRTVDFDDINSVIANWGADYGAGTGPGDANGSGLVDFDDINAIIANWGAACV